VKKTAAIICLAMCVSVLAGCASTPPITAEEFRSAAEARGLYVEEWDSAVAELIGAEIKLSAVSLDEDAKSGITSDWRVASSEWGRPGGNWQMDFYVFYDAADAVKNFCTYKSWTVSATGDARGNREAEILKDSSADEQGNQRYTSSSDTGYGVVSRKANTLVIVYVLVEYKNDVDAFLKDIGY
jgi:hypothetical protein